MTEKRFRKLMGYIRDNTCEGGDVEGVMDLTEIEDMLNEQQATINLLLEELINAQQQGYVVDFLHKNERCNLTPKELEDE